MKTAQPKYWLSPAPDKCDLCGTPITNVFIDGKTRQGPWGFLCPSCHLLDCGGHLGLGFGQRYEKQSDGKWLKVAG